MLQWPTELVRVDLETGLGILIVTVWPKASPPDIKAKDYSEPTSPTEVASSSLVQSLSRLLSPSPLISSRICKFAYGLLSSNLCAVVPDSSIAVGGASAHCLVKRSLKRTLVCNELRRFRKQISRYSHWRLSSTRPEIWRLRR